MLYLTAPLAFLISFPTFVFNTYVLLDIKKASFTLCSNLSCPRLLSILSGIISLSWSRLKFVARESVSE